MVVVSAKYEGSVHDVSHWREIGSANSPVVQLDTHYFLVLSPNLNGERGQANSHICELSSANNRGSG